MVYEVKSLLKIHQVSCNCSTLVQCGLPSMKNCNTCMGCRSPTLAAKLVTVELRFKRR